jgi:hypothetical protein
MISGGVIPGGGGLINVWHSAVGLKVDLDDAGSAQRLRLHVLDVVHRRGQGSLDDGRNAILHLRRRKAAVGPDDTNNRNVDGGENVRLHRDNRHDPQNSDEQRDHNKGVGPAKC